MMQSPSSVIFANPYPEAIPMPDIQTEIKQLHTELRKTHETLKESVDQQIAELRTKGAVPADLLQTVSGLVHVSEYLDAMRGQL